MPLNLRGERRLCGDRFTKPLRQPASNVKQCFNFSRTYFLYLNLPSLPSTILRGSLPTVKTLPWTDRPLTPVECRLLRIRIATLCGLGPTLATSAKYGYGTMWTLCLIGYLAGKDPPEWGFLLFMMLVPGAFLTYLLWRDGPNGNGDLGQRLRRMRDALEKGKAREVRITAAKVAEAEEIEDEGACFFFEVSTAQIVALQGQSYYATKRFPNSDFRLISIVDSSGTEVDFQIRNRGQKLVPIWTLNPAEKERILSALHLDDIAVMPCRLVELRAYLSAQSDRRG